MTDQLREAREALKALALELPPAVWHDVWRKFDPVLRRLEGLTSDENVEKAAKAIAHVDDGRPMEELERRFPAVVAIYREQARAALLAVAGLNEDTE